MLPHFTTDLHKIYILCHIHYTYIQNVGVIANNVIHPNIHCNVCYVHLVYAYNIDLKYLFLINVTLLLRINNNQIQAFLYKMPKF